MSVGCGCSSDIKCPREVQAAKSLGKTVRAIKPDLDELMKTGNELKTQVDSSLGIDEIRRSFNTTGVSCASDDRRHADRNTEECG